MLPQSGGGFALFQEEKKEEAKSPAVAERSIEDTAELPDIKNFIHDNGFAVEQDITYVHTDKRIL